MSSVEQRKSILHNFPSTTAFFMAAFSAIGHGSGTSDSHEVGEASPTVSPYFTPHILVPFHTTFLKTTLW